MPMIDVYARSGTFPDRHKLAVDLATTLMAISPGSLPPISSPIGQRKRSRCSTGIPRDLSSARILIALIWLPIAPI